ncbi:MAG: GNAT family N-acetyltransferase [Povalibacter sp.]
MEIAIATTNEQIDRCYPVMAELRPQLTRERFVPLVRRLESTTGLKLAYLTDYDEIRCVAGYRISEWLAGGRYLEIEDLVSKASERSKGYGGAVFDWLVQLAAENACRQVRLVSNVRRTDAHRFYVRKGMSLEAHYFSINVNPRH